RSKLADQRFAAQAPYDTDGFGENSTVHFRVAERAIDEDDGHLDYAKTTPDRAVRHFDLERVAVRVNRLEVDLLEHPSMERFEARREIADGHAEDHARVERAPFRQYLAPEPPSLDGAP